MKWSDYYEGSQELVISKNKYKPATRANNLLDGSREAQAIRCSENAQHGYGHYTDCANKRMIKAMNNPKEAFGQEFEDEAFMTERSLFLDIGCGFGFPNFMVAAIIGCQSYGVDIVPVRAKAC